MRRIVVLSEPGVVDAWGAAGMLSDVVGLLAYNVGDLCRAALQGSTAWGGRFAGHLRAGEQVPDELLAEFVSETLAQSPGGWVLFGYPRTVRQGDLLAEDGNAPDVVIQMIVDGERVGADFRLATNRHFLQVLAAYRQRAAPVQACYQARNTYRVLHQRQSLQDQAAGLVAIVTNATAATKPGRRFRNPAQ